MPFVAVVYTSGISVQVTFPRRIRPATDRTSGAAVVIIWNDLHVPAANIVPSVGITCVGSRRVFVVEPVEASAGRRGGATDVGVTCAVCGLREHVPALFPSRVVHNRSSVPAVFVSDGQASRVAAARGQSPTLSENGVIDVHGGVLVEGLPRSCVEEEGVFSRHELGPAPAVVRLITVHLEEQGIYVGEEGL